MQINIEQLQKHHVFKFPIEIGVIKDGEIVIYKMDMATARKNTTIKLDYEPDNVILDPESWLLFEEKSN
ncbi:hypothetical protein D9O36_03620 [Zobellia amurskyensis]|uniref:Uncharacterized protein n=1 Tax=Zobellia amurskyensis TaxID=248905 RepID=A0A7X2ZRA8_9FLAO|nr:hypothetical protein [Zobellia amurskyensis]MUH34919.1 hypothetical protein [Zobellia amurskyensis]